VLIVIRHYLGLPLHAPQLGGAIRAGCKNNEKRQIAAVSNDLPEVIKHTATGGPCGTLEVMKVPSLYLRR